VFLHPFFKKIAVFFLAGYGMVFAAPVSLQEAQNVAQNWFRYATGQKTRIKPRTERSLGQSSAHQSAYRIIELELRGWVIVASDDAVEPILGYGETPIDARKLPASVAHWLDGIDREIKSVINADRSGTHTPLGARSTSPLSWQQLRQAPKTFDRLLIRRPLGAGGAHPGKTPLLWKGAGSDLSGIRWAQAPYYNAKTPNDSRGPGGHTLTGCVATAMGQVMRYYKRPTTGWGSFGYSDPNYGYQWVDFSAADYRWDEMPFALDEHSTSDQIDAVATLLYHLGVSVAMEYSTTSSNAYYYQPNDDPSAVEALRTYFGYVNAAYAERVSYFTDGSRQINYDWDDWEELLKSALDQGDPILYAGTGSIGGHAFVMDGYSTDGTYHINWGYGGEANGWYRLSSLKFVNQSGAEYDFTNHQQAIFLNENGSVDVSAYEPPDGDPDFDVGGGCTYNPRAKGMDALMLLMVLMAMIYPLRRRYLTARK
jgi:hypothetical protein